ncbi:putative tRNA-splicing endonuclease subunit sen-2 [Cladorrhinum sp. PSN259]|nr:putative tRNA-splicing endonuclease subunit sen-2 [Cladorrhinum sp. PSN259]
MDPPAGSEAGASTSVVGRPRIPLGQIYALPAPIRTFPLPTFYPNNPISLFHLVYAWLKQVISPPSAEPSVIHVGVWDPETRSVHVKNLASIRALWEQGFYGKGSLSRSEPNWLKRELARRGSADGKSVSEVRTENRREERRLAKWERAKAELEALEQQKMAEAAGSFPSAPIVPIELSVLSDETNNVIEKTKEPATQQDVPAAPSPVVTPVQQPAVKEVTPVSSELPELKSPISLVELLALPNSSSLSIRQSSQPASSQSKPPVGPAELLAMPNSLAELVTKSLAKNVCEAWNTLVPRPFSPVDAPTPVDTVTDVNGHADKASAFARSVEQVPKEPTRGTNTIFPAELLPAHVPLTPSKRSAGGVPREDTDCQPSKRQKNVRFSPKVESVEGAPKLGLPGTGASVSKSEAATPQPTEIVDKEHFQLSPEEAFFLQFSLGALKVTDPKTGEPIRTERLLSLFRSHSYFPPSADIRPDDPFLIHYTVYHHFRTLGWVPRHGIKFGVDWILYQRGPVFDHSEFGIMVMPAYTNELWNQHEYKAVKKDWSWLMGVNRVLSHVLKSLVLVYVNIPPPPVFDEAMQRGGIAAALKTYNIREVMVRRFSVNRNR